MSKYSKAYFNPYSDSFSCRVAIVSPEVLQEAEQRLAEFPGGMESAMKRAMARATAYLRTQSTREIRKKYADVGEIVYKRYVDGDSMDEELAGHCEVVMGLQKELAECKESMAAKQGKNVCPACGISNPKDAVFCMYCGTELPGEEEEKEEEWFTQGPVEETEDQEEKEEKEGEEPETEVEEETEEPQEETKEETAPEQDAEQEVWDACAQKEDGDEE